MGVSIQEGGGEIQFLGGGAIRPSFAGKGKTQDWSIQSGAATGSVKIQEQGGETEIGGSAKVAGDLTLAGHLYLSSGGGTMETLESRLETMETQMRELSSMYEELRSSR